MSHEKFDESQLFGEIRRRRPRSNPIRHARKPAWHGAMRVLAAYSPFTRSTIRTFNVSARIFSV
jgi:hypothetical protein